MLSLSGLFVRCGGIWTCCLFLCVLTSEAEGIVFPTTNSIHQSVRRGREFLSSMILPELDLLPEFRDAKVIWLYHDNYLAARTLRSSHPEVARRIEAALVREGIRESGKIEIVFDEAKQPLPFRHYELKTVRQSGGFQLRTEVVTDRIMMGWEQYSDLLLLACLAEVKEHPDKAHAHWDAAMLQWDGRGFNDQAAKSAHQYATYKLALALLAHAKLGDVKIPPGLAGRLLRMQEASGGWITDYDLDGAPKGFANVETSSLAILGFDAYLRTR